MGDELIDNTYNENRRRRPVPIPIYDTNRYMEKPYLMKHEIAKIRNNLDELVEIKTGFVDKPTENKLKIDMPEPKKIDKKDDKKDERKDDFFLNSTTDTRVPNITTASSPDIKPEIVIPTPTINIPITDPKVKSESKVETKIETKPEVKPEFVSEIKKDEIKFGISNLENKQSINDNKPKSKIIKKKVIKRMNDEDVATQYNISPEERRRRLKSEIQEFHEEDKTKEAIRKSVDLAELNQKGLEQNRKELEQTRSEIQEWKKSLATENAQIKNDLKTEFGNKINELGGRFNEITGKFDKVSTKLEETCTGIDCLKKDLANMNKNFELVECPECGEKAVPPLASFCPECSAKMKGWFEDDGVTPIRGWKPTWQK